MLTILKYNLTTANNLNVFKFQSINFSVLSRLLSIADHFAEESKMVFVVRTDLNMKTGKIASQCAHAALECYKICRQSNPKIVKAWEKFGKAKVVLRTNNEQSLFDLQNEANSLGLVNVVIRDAGRTQVSAGSATILGIGPGPVSLVDQVTGNLKLY